MTKISLYLKEHLKAQDKKLKVIEKKLKKLDDLTKHLKQTGTNS